MLHELVTALLNKPKEYKYVEGNGKFIGHWFKSIEKLR